MIHSHFHDNSSCIDQKQSGPFRTDIYESALWCRSTSKSGSNEFKCDFIRGLLGLGGGVHSIVSDIPVCSGLFPIELLQ